MMIVVENPESQAVNALKLCEVLTYEIGSVCDDDELVDIMGDVLKKELGTKNYDFQFFVTPDLIQIQILNKLTGTCVVTDIGCVDLDDVEIEAEDGEI